MASRAALRATMLNSGSRARCYATAASPQKPPHLLSLADLTVPEISTLLQSAYAMKQAHKANPVPSQSRKFGRVAEHDLLQGRTVALMFSKRSTRTRVSAETAVAAMGGHAMFLGSQDMQLGVNESLLDTSKVVSSMVDGIFARVGAHSEVEVCVYTARICRAVKLNLLRVERARLWHSIRPCQSSTRYPIFTTLCKSSQTS